MVLYLQHRVGIPTQPKITPAIKKEASMPDLPFEKFMAGLRGDARLGRYVAPVCGQSPEAVVLRLVMDLADAREGNYPNPAFQLLERMEA